MLTSHMGVAQQTIIDMGSVIDKIVEPEASRSDHSTLEKAMELQNDKNKALEEAISNHK